MTGAADGYARAAGKPAATLLHCGPGLANGKLANLHNARRASTPIVNIVGDQATYHRPYDPPLTADTEGFARGVSAGAHGQRRRQRRADAAAASAGRADRARPAFRDPDPPLRHLLERRRCGRRGAAASADAAGRAEPGREEAAAILRRGGEGVVLLIGHAGLTEAGQALAHRIAGATGCRVMADVGGRIPRGQGRLMMDRVPYVVDVAVAAMAGTKHLILCSAKKPVTFFAYPGKPQTSIPESAQVHVLARREQDPLEALTRLAETLHAPPLPPPNNGAKPEVGRGPVTPDSFGATIGALIPEGALVVDESITYGRSLGRFTQAAAPHDWMSVLGGAIGGGMPLATWPPRSARPGGG